MGLSPHEGKLWKILKGRDTQNFEKIPVPCALCGKGVWCGSMTACLWVI